MFSVRLVSADHYMGSPISGLDVGYSEFRGTDVKQVPVIRIFGSTVTGKKTCLHVHGVFPYIYIPYEGSVPHDRLMYQIASSLDKALNIALGKANSAVQHVYKVVPVSGLPFYGFHTKQHLYFKIYFYNPLMIKKATELLQNGAILNKIYQPHEAHVPYILQFMIDYNLYGMNLVHLENIRLRRNPENPGALENFSEEMLLPERVSRISTCELEADTTACDILNRKAITDELAVNPGLAAIWEDEKHRRKEEGRKSQITPQSSQQRSCDASSNSELFFKQRLREKLNFLNSQLSDNSSVVTTPEETRTPYPAETPEGSDLADASFLDVHIQSSGSTSYVSNKDTKPDDYNTSFVDEDLVLSLSSSQRVSSSHNSVLFDSQDIELAEVLQNLEGSADIDDDSVLGSHVSKIGNYLMDGSDCEEDMQDLSQPFESAKETTSCQNPQEETDNRLTDDQDSDDALWESTFWDKIYKNIPQLDGADDVPKMKMPKRRRFGMRGKVFSTQSVYKPLNTNAVSAVVRDSPKVTKEKSQLCHNGSAKLNTPEKGSIHIDIFGIDRTNERNHEIVEELETVMEKDNLSSLENSLEHCGCNTDDDFVGMTKSEFEANKVMVNGVVVLTDIENGPPLTRDTNTGIECDIGCVTVGNLLVTESNNQSLNAGNVEALPQDCCALSNDSEVITDKIESEVLERNMEAMSQDYSSTLCDTIISDNDTENVDVRAQSKIKSAVMNDVSLDIGDINPVSLGAEEIKITSYVSENLTEVYEDDSVSDTVDTALNVAVDTSAVLHDLSGKSKESDARDTKIVEMKENGTGDENSRALNSYQISEESPNSDMKFQPVSVVCCNACTSSCTSGSAGCELYMKGANNSFEMYDADYEQSNSVLIGDPSFTAALDLSEGDDFSNGELQVNSLFCDGNSSSTWLSPDQISETSQSSYLSDIDTTLLTQYESPTIQEVSPENSSFSRRTLTKTSDQKQRRGLKKCDKVIQLRRMTRASKSHNPSESLEPHSKKCELQLENKKTNRISASLAPKKMSNNEDSGRMNKMRSLSKQRLKISTDIKEVLCPSVLSTINTLSSCTPRCPLDVSPVEVKRIETILWKGNFEDIIEFQDNVNLSPENHIENNVYKGVHKLRKRTKNGYTARASNVAVISKETRKQLIQCLRKRKEKSHSRNYNQNVPSVVCQNNSTLTKENVFSHPSNAKPCTIIINKEVAKRRSIGSSDNTYAKSLAKKLQKEKRSKLSLSYRRKAASVTEVEESTSKKNNKIFSKPTDIRPDTCITFMEKSQDKCRFGGSCETKTITNTVRQNIYAVSEKKIFDCQNMYMSHEETINKISSFNSPRKYGSTKSVHKLEKNDTTRQPKINLQESSRVSSKCGTSDKNSLRYKRCKGAGKGREENENVRNNCKRKETSPDSRTSIMLASPKNIKKIKCRDQRGSRGISNSNKNLDISRSSGHHKCKLNNFEKNKKLTSDDIRLLVHESVDLKENYNSLVSSNSRKSQESWSVEHSVQGRRHLSRCAKEKRDLTIRRSVRQLNKTNKLVEAHKLTEDVGDSSIKEQVYNLDNVSKKDENLKSRSKRPSKSEVPEMKQSTHTLSVFSKYKTLKQRKPGTKMSCKRVQNSKSRNQMDMNKDTHKNNCLYVNLACIKPCYVKLEKLEETGHTKGIDCLHTKLDKLTKNPGVSCNKNVSKCSSSRQLTAENASLPHLDVVHHNGILPKSHKNYIKRKKSNSTLGNGTKNSSTVTLIDDKTLYGNIQENKEVVDTESLLKTDSDINLASLRFSTDGSSKNKVFVTSNEEICDVFPVAFKVPKNTKNELLVNNEKTVKTQSARNIEVVHHGTSESNLISNLCCLKTKCKSNCDREHIRTNSLQKEHRKHLRRKTESIRGVENKLSGNELKKKCDLFHMIKPLSISLEKLDQSCLEKYSIILSTGTDTNNSLKISDFRGQKIQQISSSDDKQTHLNQKRGEKKESGNSVHHDKIPNLDGAFETSSSDDSTGSRSVESSDYFKNLEKSPFSKKAKKQRNEKLLMDSHCVSVSSSSSTVLPGTSLHKQTCKTSPKEFKRKITSLSSQTSPRRSLYPSLAIKIQKSPKKKKLSEEGTMQKESQSVVGITELAKDTKTSECTHSVDNRKFSLEIKRRKKSATSKEKGGKRIECPSEICSVFKKRKRTSLSISSKTSQTSISSGEVAAVSDGIAAHPELPSKQINLNPVVRMVDCDSGTTAMDSQNVPADSSEKFMSLSYAGKGRRDSHFEKEREDGQLEPLCKVGSNVKCNENLKYDNKTPVQSACSFPTKGLNNVYECSEIVDEVCNESVSVNQFNALCNEDKGMEHLMNKLGENTESDFTIQFTEKTARKKLSFPLTEKQPVKEIESLVLEQNLEKNGKDFSKGCNREVLESENSVSIQTELLKRKCVGKRHPSICLFSDEDCTSSGIVPSKIIDSDENLFHENQVKAICKHSARSLNVTESSDIILCEGTNLKNDTSLRIKNAEEDYISSDEDQCILSFYNESMIVSPTTSSSSPSASSKQILNKESLLSFEITKQNSCDDIHEICSDSANHFSSQNLSNNLTRSKIYTPKYMPPSRDEIMKSLSEFCIPEYCHQEPYASNVLDTTDKKEIGNRVLKINSTSVFDLEPYVSSLQNVTSIEMLRRRQIQEFSFSMSRSSQSCIGSELSNMKPALAGNREVIITPCLLPPSVNKVKSWLKSRELSKVQDQQKDEVEVEHSSVKIAMPLSPGQDEDSDIETLSLTPNSPITPQNVGVTEKGVFITTHSTPQTALTSCFQSNVPSPLCTPIHTVKHKIHSRRTQVKRSKKGPRLNSSSQELASPVLPAIKEELEEVADGVSTDLEHVTKTEDKYAPSTSFKLECAVTCNPEEKLVCENKNSNATQPACHEVGSTLPSGTRGSVEDHPINIIQQKEIHNMQISPRSVTRADSSCQIDESTPNNTYGFRMSFENLQEVRAVCEHQFVTTFVMELLIHTRGDFKPDPACDPVRALFFIVVNDVPDDFGVPKQESGVIVVHNSDEDVKASLLQGGVKNSNVIYVPDEVALLHELVKYIRKWDPDILAGYEVEMLSWGYLFQRASTLQINLYSLVSRVPTASGGNKKGTETESAFTITDEIKLPGRILLNVWRLMRHEAALQSYTFENVMYHILHQRIALHSFKTLTSWWEHRTHLYRWICVDYYLLRVRGIVKLLDHLDLVGRTSELAKLFGIQFIEVLSRGSQFRVESMMLRLAKPLNYVPVSPSIQQRAKMRAPEFLPLILEPDSRFYSDPVIVLDFQSLYPSIIIAYNYCFSTCLGRIEHLGQSIPFPFGCTYLKVPPAELIKLENNINISPCGVAFVKDKIRKGVLPRMLQEILDTRLMVKKSMKEHKSNKTLQRVLHARQLGLKLIANVTYGYTAANFSGRMPCIEVGDSVVSKARETLERAIHLIEVTPKWGAQVVYGDTDSLFVLVPGKNREQAFKIGAEIVDAVTLDNPKPVKLKLEKVYQPCILQTKKRYVGYMYESPEQEKPIYEAKGIETVRRDGCPAVAKILEKSLKIVFETKDVSLVKKYVCRQFAKILQGRVSIQDLIFAREYRGMAGYRPGACVPALELTRRWLQTDKCAEPRQSERVPYIIVNGPPGLPLIRLVRSPHELLVDPSLRPNATYYITRVIIPPLDRCFSLLGVDIASWYADMPRKFIVNLPTTVPCGLKKSTISQYFATMNCAVCNQQTNTGVCLRCQQQPQKMAVILMNKIRLWERAYTNITKVCQSCCGRPDAIDCTSLDCPILFRRIQASRDLDQAPFIRSLQEQYMTF